MKARLDVWLWRARFFKTRSAAARAVSEGAVRLERAGASRTAAKPAELIGPGDGLSVRAGGRWRTARVLDCGERRGPASEARLLYRELALDEEDELGHVPPSPVDGDGGTDP